MKILKVILLGTIALSSVNGVAKSEYTKIATVHNDVQTKIFKVYGNCGMCKKTIEDALKDVDGIESAIWKVDSKMIEVKFDVHEITLLEIKEKIAEVGYDTTEVRTSKENYNKLPGCCQYERPETKK